MDEDLLTNCGWIDEDIELNNQQWEYIDRSERQLNEERFENDNY